MDGLGRFLLLIAVPFAVVWAIIRTVDRASVLMGVVKLTLGTLFVVVMLRVGGDDLISLLYLLGGGLIGLLGVVDLIAAKVALDLRDSEQSPASDRLKAPPAE